MLTVRTEQHYQEKCALRCHPTTTQSSELKLTTNFIQLHLLTGHTMLSYGCFLYIYITIFAYLKLFIPIYGGLRSKSWKCSQSISL